MGSLGDVLNPSWGSLGSMWELLGATISSSNYYLNLSFVGVPLEIHVRPSWSPLAFAGGLLVGLPGGGGGGWPS